MMRVPVTGLQLAIFLASGGALAAFTWAQDPSRPKSSAGESAAISVKSFRTMPVGYLGVPLGTVVRVTGVAVDGDTTRRRANAGKTILRVEAVNGKKLPEPVVFEFRRASEAVRKPAAGVRFDYSVHEYGHFDGVVTPPKELHLEKPIVANDGFYYRRYVTVHASNSVRE